MKNQWTIFAPYLKLGSRLQKIAVGDKAITDVSFYASLHQRALEEKYTQIKKDVSASTSQPDFTGTEWDLIRSGAQDDPTVCNVSMETYTDYEHMSKMIESMAEDMKNNLLRNDPQLSSGIDKFISRYFNLQACQLSRFCCESQDFLGYLQQYVHI